jgi:hypothetical protein
MRLWELEQGVVARPGGRGGCAVSDVGLPPAAPSLMREREYEREDFVRVKIDKRRW